MTDRTVEKKIIISGHVASGKTTALRTLLGEKLLSTDAAYSESRSLESKRTTTVAMDYGVIRCPRIPVKLHLYAIPGQERFQFMWEILGKNADGLIVLIDAARPRPIDAIHLYLDKILPFLNSTSVVVALNKLDPEQRASLRLPPYLRHGDLRLRLTTTDVRDAEEVMALLRLLTAEMIEAERR